MNEAVESLGQLQPVNLREVFADEAADFTPWLAGDAGLAFLGETLDLSLKLEAQEQAVGSYRADILCKEEDSGEWIVIENQVEPTNHKHLGQLLTYAAGLGATKIIWVAERFTDEHRATLDWLNENTSDNIRFFGLEIELWRIEDSKIAPKFNVVCEPNDWSRTIKAVSGKEGATTAIQEQQLRFWTVFRDYLQSNQSSIQCQKPRAQRAMKQSIGWSDVFLRSAITVWDAVSKERNPEIRVALLMEGSRAKKLYAALESKKEEIERACGGPLIWDNGPDSARCKIYTREKTDFQDESLWPEQMKWLRENLERFQKVFVPLVKETEGSSVRATGATAK